MNITTNNIELKVRVPLTLEPTYRALAHDERIRNGDEFYFGDQWNQSTIAGRTPEFSGYRYRRPIPATIDTRTIHTKHRPLASRQMSLDGRQLHVLDFPIPEPAIPNPEPGDGYRLLEVGERILPSDEVYYESQWTVFGGRLDTLRVGSDPLGLWPVGRYRRRITADPLSEVLKTLKEISTDSSQSSKKIEALIAKLETK